MSQPPDQPVAPALDERIRGTLREIFGFTEFRPHQEAIVRALLDGQDAFVVMPTGGGKSLCYQLPARLLEGTALVVSPLISLMKDQVDAANANGLRAAFLNSSQEPEERSAVVRDLRAGALDLLYISPERFALEGFASFLKTCRLSFVAVDEAHCISEWGHDFRPDYLSLGALVDTFPGLPIAAFTATATPRVQEDIIARLRLRQPLVVRASFNRPNLFYRVQPKHDVNEQILNYVRQRAGQSGIIYRTTRKSVEETAAYLNENGIAARPYHAGLEDEVRAAHQEAFNRDDVPVVVATIAFGMGIDKSNVRYVLHGDLPKNIEGYYQETGRSGRDGDPAECLLLFSYGDIPKLRFFIDKMEDEEERRRTVRGLNEVVSYATTHACRRRQLLGYFGETFGETSCQACDVCAGEVARVDATRDAQILLSAVARTGERFGAGHVVDVVTGAKTERIRSFGHDQLKTYGLGKERDKRYWRRLMDTLLAEGVVALEDAEFPVVKLCPAAWEVMSGKRTVAVSEEVPQPRGKRKDRAGRRSASRSDAEPLAPADEALFETLRQLRYRLASEFGVPAYVVFTDRTLHEMARQRPVTAAELLRVPGVGDRKLMQFGPAFLAVLQEAEGSAG